MFGLLRRSCAAVLVPIAVATFALMLAGCSPKVEQAMECEDVLHPAQYPTDFSYSAPNPDKLEPTVADVLRCFGKPDLYALQDIPAEVPEIGFSMWYLHRGLIFQTVESKGLIPRKVDLTSRLRGPFLVVPPGSAEQMAAS